MNINPNKRFSESQRRMIRMHLEKGNSINPMVALKKFNCFRLSSVIFDLRAEGMNIKTVWKVLKNGKRIGEYILVN